MEMQADKPYTGPTEAPQKPLLNYVPLSGGLPQRRDYDGHWFNCCGDCDSTGWAACCLSCWFPYIALGWNIARASGKAHLGILVGLVSLGFYVMNWSVGRADGVWNCDSSICTYQAGTAAMFAFVVYFIAIVVIGVLSRSYMRRSLQMDSMVYDQFQLGCSDFWSWFCLPVCPCFPCGLSQETRTLMINRVEDGAWNGPATMQMAV